MTLQERLRAQARWVPVKRWVGRNAEVSKIIPKLEEEAADALDAQNAKAADVCVDIYNDYSEGEVGGLPVSVRGAWSVGSEINAASAGEKK